VTPTPPTPVTRSLFPALTAISEYTIDNVKKSAESLDWKAAVTPDPDWSIYQGFVLGLQLNSENTDHQCYQSFLSLKADVRKLPEYLRTVSGTSSTNIMPSTGNTIVDALGIDEWYYQPGVWFKVIKRAQEFSALFFDLYE